MMFVQDTVPIILVSHGKKMKLGRFPFWAALLLFTTPLVAQDDSTWNLNIGGGIGFPLSSTQDFVNNGGHLVVGGGPNFGRFFGLSGEFMLHNLPIKHSVMDAFQVPGASAREYTLTVNGIVRIPTARRAGFYLIGGAGWYQRSEELSAPTVAPGIVCPAFWVWWGACVNGLFPANAVLASSTTSNAFGENVGGGFTFRVGPGSTKFYTEIRYHHASHNHIDTDLLPLTFGLRW